MTKMTRRRCHPPRSGEPDPFELKEDGLQFRQRQTNSRMAMGA